MTRRELLISKKPPWNRHFWHYKCQPWFEFDTLRSCFTPPPLKIHPGLVLLQFKGATSRNWPPGERLTVLAFTHKCVPKLTPDTLLDAEFTCGPPEHERFVGIKPHVKREVALAASVEF